MGGSKIIYFQESFQVGSMGKAQLASMGTASPENKM